MSTRPLKFIRCPNHPPIHHRKSIKIKKKHKFRISETRHKVRSKVFRKKIFHLQTWQKSIRRFRFYESAKLSDVETASCVSSFTDSNINSNVTNSTIYGTVTMTFQPEKRWGYVKVERANNVRNPTT